MEDPAQVPRKVGLERLVRESLAQPHRAIVNVILSPQAKSRLDKGQAGISIVSLGQLLVKLKREPLELVVRPVGESRRLPLALGLRFVVIRESLDVARNSGRAPRIDEVITHDRLVPARGDLLQQAVHRAPVVSAAVRHHIAVLHVTVFELDRIGAIVFGRRPEHDAGHRLYVRDPALERHGHEPLIGADFRGNGEVCRDNVRRNSKWMGCRPLSAAMMMIASPA